MRSRDVKFEVETTGLGFRTDARIERYRDADDVQASKTVTGDR